MVTPLSVVNSAASFNRAESRCVLAAVPRLTASIKLSLEAVPPGMAAASDLISPAAAPVPMPAMFMRPKSNSRCQFFTDTTVAHASTVRLVFEEISPFGRSR